MPTPMMMPMIRLVVSHKPRRGGRGRLSRIVGSIGRTPSRVYLGHGDNMGRCSPDRGRSTKHSALIIARYGSTARPIGFRFNAGAQAVEKGPGNDASPVLAAG